jgi:multidrug efflux pump subunit AcrA (membrane-fusion protein)
MRLRRTIIILLELLILLGLGGWLYRVWKTRPPLPTQSTGDNDADDQKYYPRVPVNVGAIARTTLHGYLDAYGTVEPEPATDGQPAAVANISSPAISLISAVNCIEGQQVKKGEILFTVGATNITAPIDGTVTLLTAHAGEVALPRRTAVQVTDLNRLVIAASVPAAQLHEAHVGQEAQIELPGATTQPSRLISKVSFIDPQVDPTTGLGSIDVKVPTGTNLRPGEFVSVRIIAVEHRDCLVVPAQSIAHDGGGQPGISLVMRDHEWAVRQPVKIGLREGDQVEISGVDLQPGMLIVTTGAAALPDHCRIEINK